MADRKQGYLDKAKRQMKRKGTVGAFTEYCGGKVTEKCIDRALNSNDETLRKRAQFAKNMRNLKEGGQKDEAKKLPGGIMQPIGYGAFKFHGNKHDEAGMGSDSGIILERGGKRKPGLEVEDGELQVDVDTTEGEKEYIVSDYIKNPATGNTLAEDLERELKRAKNNQEAAKITARYVRLNEQLRGEEGEPNKIKAQEGTFASDDPEYVMPAQAGDEDYEIAPEGSQAREFIEGQSKTELGTYEKEGEKVGKDEVASLKENNPWFDWENFDPAKPEDVKRFQEEYNAKAPEGEQIKVDGKLGAQTASAFVPYTKKEEELDFDESDIVIDEEEEEEEKTPETPKEEAPAEETPAEETPEGESAKFRPRMTGTMLQALGPLAALNSGLSTAKMAPAYSREIRMGRVNLDPERAAAAQQTQGASQGITSAVAGPAALAMQQKNLSAGQQAQRGITDQENRANIQIANREKGINAGIRQNNARNAMTASQVNAAAMNRTAAQNQATKLAAMNQLGKIGTQTVKDYNQQYANFGSDMMEYGPVAADYYANVYKGNTPFGIGSRDINVTQMDPSEVTATFNRLQQANAQQAATETPTPDPAPEPAKRGRYIKKSNRVRRKKRRK